MLEDSSGVSYFQRENRFVPFKNEIFRQADWWLWFVSGVLNIVEHLYVTPINAVCYWMVLSGFDLERTPARLHAVCCLMASESLTVGNLHPSCYFFVPSCSTKPFVLCKITLLQLLCSTNLGNYSLLCLPWKDLFYYCTVASVYDGSEQLGTTFIGCWLVSPLLSH